MGAVTKEARMEDDTTPYPSRGRRAIATDLGVGTTILRQPDGRPA